MEREGGSTCDEGSDELSQSALDAEGSGGRYSRLQPFARESEVGERGDDGDEERASSWKARLPQRMRQHGTAREAQHGFGTDLEVYMT